MEKNPNFEIAPILGSPRQEQEFFAKQKVIASWGSASLSHEGSSATLQ